MANEPKPLSERINDLYYEENAGKSVREWRSMILSLVKDAKALEVAAKGPLFDLDQITKACANVGCDLKCGACAAVFFTGVGLPGDPHTCSKVVSSVVVEQPRFVHDCTRCVFLGNFEHEGDRSDLYYCDKQESGRTYLARYGDEGSNYSSAKRPPSLEIALTEARRRAEESEQEIFPEQTTVYGHDRTIHRREDLGVEVDGDGKVVSVWFRCMALPFHQAKADEQRAHEMRTMYRDHQPPGIVAVEVKTFRVVPEPEERKDVHTEHCCEEHLTCKYGHDDCPVVNRKLRSSYPCNCEHM